MQLLKKNIFAVSRVESEVVWDKGVNEQPVKIVSACSVQNRCWHKRHTNKFFNMCSSQVGSYCKCLGKFSLSEFQSVNLRISLDEATSSLYLYNI